MDYITFKMDLLELLQKRMGDGIAISLECIPKNNGIMLDGLVFDYKGSNVTPIIYLEEFYDFWKRGISLEVIAEKIMESCMECVERVSASNYFFQTYEEMKPHIYYKIINYEKNREFLKQVPHRRVLDLAMVFYYRMEEMEPMATVLIQNAHLEMWEITEEELERNARKYTYLNLPAVFMTMAQVMEMDEEEWELAGGASAMPMYVLTNKDKQLGAGTILYPGILQQAEALLGDNYFILPSSIHECILVPAQSMYNQEELTRMVTDINNSHVDAREILSNQAYYYEKRNGRIVSLR